MNKIRYAVLSLLLFVAALALVTPTINNATAASATKVSREQWIDSRTVDIYVQSPSTDSWTKEVRLLLPKGWSKTANKNWPALWLLHGGKDDYQSWTKGTDIEELSANRDMVVVLPNTSWCSQYTDWWNYGKYGSPAWETYITSELRSLLQNKYHVDGNNAAVAGNSMGGLGAFKLAMNHPDMFKGAASFSGNVDPLHAYNGTSDGTDPATIGCLGLVDWKKVWGDQNIPEQKAIWEKNDPYVQAAKFAQLQYIFLSSGDGTSDPINGKATDDNFFEKQVNVESRAMAEKLKTLGIDADTDFYGGVHSWPYWQIELHKAFPGLLEVMGVQ